MAKKRLYLTVHGIVQGVNFRYYTKQEALGLGLVGWVRNKPDGSVEAVAEGDEGVLKKFLEWCTHGPSSSRVTKLDSQWAPATGEFSDFVIVR
jgi:acylphosphatase